MTSTVQRIVRADCPVADQHGAYSKNTGVKMGPYDDLVYIYKRNSDTSKIYRLECRICQTHLLHEDRPDEPKDIGKRWVPGLEKTGVEARKSVSWDERQGRLEAHPECERAGCGSRYTELHHWAPQAYFGYEPNNGWPTGWLCVPHHLEWHRTMDGYEWQPKTRRQVRTMEEREDVFVSMKTLELRDENIDYYDQLLPGEAA